MCAWCQRSEQGVRPLKPEFQMSVSRHVLAEEQTLALSAKATGAPDRCALSLRPPSQITF